MTNSPAQDNLAQSTRVIVTLADDALMRLAGSSIMRLACLAF